MIQPFSVKAKFDFLGVKSKQLNKSILVIVAGFSFGQTGDLLWKFRDAAGEIRAEDSGDLRFSKLCEKTVG